MQVGFHLNTPAHEGAVDWESTLASYLDLVSFAEDIGVDSVWSRQRHFEEGYLSAPLIFFAAAAARTKRISFGTALLMFRYWDPVLLAEELSTLDLITHHRLDVAYSNSREAKQPYQDRVLGVSEDEANDRIEHSLDRLRHALSGEPLLVLDEPTPVLPAGTEVRLQPRSPSLVDRIWYGSGSVNSAREAGEAGINLFVSTVGPGDVEATQVKQLAAYKAAYASDRPTRIGVGRYVIPVTKPGQAARYAAWEKWFREDFARFGTAPIYVGSPDQIVDELSQSTVFAQGDILLVYLPFGFTFPEYEEQLEALMTTVAPQLGWKPDLGA
jgi:alkanesulfonate monooxygenase SsuD/methylene tetrahydromethanopterin reductase-like flavin-dependent oxidoreductase (luciferase family)